MDSTSWTVIGGMAAAIVAMAGFVGKLYHDLASMGRRLSVCQEARISMAEEHHREVSTLKDMIRSRKNGGSHGP